MLHTLPLALVQPLYLVRLSKKNLPNSLKKKTINKEEILKWFESKESLIATPHAQKSLVKFKLKIKSDIIDKFSVLNCIDEIEKILGTPVQTGC